MLKYLSSVNYWMAYSDTRIVIGGLAHIPVLNFFCQFFLKGSLELKPKRLKILWLMKSQLKLLR